MPWHFVTSAISPPVPSGGSPHYYFNPHHDCPKLLHYTVALSELFLPHLRCSRSVHQLSTYIRGILSGGPASPVIFINASRPFEMVSRLIRAALMRYSVCLLLAKAARIKYKTELTERRRRARRSGASCKPRHVTRRPLIRLTYRSLKNTVYPNRIVSAAGFTLLFSILNFSANFGRLLKIKIRVTFVKFLRFDKFLQSCDQNLTATALSYIVACSHPARTISASVYIYVCTL